MAETKISDIITNSLESIRSVVDANTIIGTPINTDSGTVIIPVSKVSVGFASGGVDFSNKQPEKDANFGGGGGTGLSVNPVGFLIVKADGSVEMLSAKPEGGTDVADVVDKVPAIIAKVKDLFKSKKQKKDDEETEEIEVEIEEDASDAE